MRDVQFFYFPPKIELSPESAAPVGKLALLQPAHIDVMCRSKN